MQAYAKAVVEAQEAFSNIRTVHMFISVKRYIDRSTRALEACHYR
ncbi:hypothetical protein PF008_g13529 [Phytophthora fragariae]|uniref:Uncharacterized protein n=1 Tax=Phytophthora fragariae TaxID=53985 RepID=A0A6G0RJM4_9STRA|nr:hypothetical protein PF008_g13529 [Phytophthora fragariae]